MRATVRTLITVGAVSAMLTGGVAALGQTVDIPEFEAPDLPDPPSLPTNPGGDSDETDSGGAATGSTSSDETQEAAEGARDDEPAAQDGGTTEFPTGEPDGDDRIIGIVSTVVDLDSGTRSVESEEQVELNFEADVFFEFDESDLLDEAIDILDDAADQFADAAVDTVTVAGHTDAIGADDYNQTLSEERAAAVADHLDAVTDGISYSTEGHGPHEPVAPNETEDGEDYPEGRALNRRVEVTYDRS